MKYVSNLKKDLFVVLETKKDNSKELYAYCTQKIDVENEGSPKNLGENIKLSSLLELINGSSNDEYAKVISSLIMCDVIKNINEELSV